MGAPDPDWQTGDGLPGFSLYFVLRDVCKQKGARKSRPNTANNAVQRVLASTGLHLQLLGIQPAADETPQYFNEGARQLMPGSKLQMFNFCGRLKADQK